MRLIMMSGMFGTNHFAPVALLKFLFTYSRASLGAIDLRTFGAKYKLSRRDENYYLLI